MVPVPGLRIALPAIVAADVPKLILLLVVVMLFEIVLGPVV